MVTGAAEALVRETFGLPLLAYLCGVEESELEGRLSGALRLRPAAESVLVNELVPLAERATIEAAKHQGLPVGMALSVLGQRHEPSGASIGNALRIAAGGTVPAVDVSTENEIGRVLLEMAVDQYPVLLIPSEPWGPPATLSLFRHPSADSLNGMVASDRDLSRLFPDEDEGLGRIGFVYSSLGSGSTLQTVLFAEVIVRSAWAAAAMTVRQPSVEDLGREVLTHLDAVRRAARGDEAHVRALIAFTGFTTKDGANIQTPWGHLRPLTERENELTPPSLEGAVSGTHPDGTHVTVSYAGELILDTQLPYALVGTPHRLDEPRHMPSFAAADDFRHRIEAVQLAGLLAVDRPAGSQLIARVAWIQIADPLAHGPRMQWSDTRTAPSFFPHQLSHDECASYGRWCELIRRHRAPPIEIAIRRVISAAHIRTEPADRLVDAVIAWENLFGTSEGEPRLRISAAMAWLLADSVSTREQLQARLRSLYDARSKIVHGGLVDNRLIADDANDAFGFAVKTLAALFRDKPELITLGDGAARSLRLLLGG